MEFFTQLEFNPNLVCAVCRDLIETAVQPPCGHVFCLACLLAWTNYQIPKNTEFWLEGIPSCTCPSCRFSFQNYEITLVPVIDRIISDLNYKCSKCNTNLKYQNIKNHNCKFSLSCPEIQCPFQCNNLENLLIHQNQCLYSTTICNICFGSFSIYKFFIHKQNCIVKYLEK